VFVAVLDCASDAMASPPVPGTTFRPYSSIVAVFAVATTCASTASETLAALLGSTFAECVVATASRASYLALSGRLETVAVFALGGRPASGAMATRSVA